MMPLKIEKIYAWIAEEDDGQQGVIAFLAPTGMQFPLVGADKTLMESFKSYAEDIAKQHQKKIFFMEFSTKKILEIVSEQDQKH
jgi:hypothetical protein